ncbi:MAG: sensor domain CHASE-containing protein, partial [Ulvibacter sp.]
MIKFFRKIRQKMLSESKLGKYLLYAIGEIVLVVIGILIALQINNNSANQKKQQFEITILENIKEDISADKLDC